MKRSRSKKEAASAAEAIQIHATTGYVQDPGDAALGQEHGRLGRIMRSNTSTQLVQAARREWELKIRPVLERAIQGTVDPLYRTNAMELHKDVMDLRREAA